jgi:hypothetical protein
MGRIGVLFCWVACCALVVLLRARPVGAQFFSPGPLARVHASIDGDEHCGDCHSAGNRVANAKCLDCHQDVGRSVERRTGYHGRNTHDQSCGHCHVDHRGVGQHLIRWEPEHFDHAEAGYVLRGGHAKVACKDCHTAHNERGAPTYFGLKTDCASCHEDKHQGRFGTRCATCHTETRWPEVTLQDFDHDQARFALRGKHAQVECAKCHGEPPKYQPLPFADCNSCHQDPHNGQFKQSCASCHTESRWSNLSMTRAQHPRLNILGGHTEVPCGQCHDRGNLRPPSRGTQCVSCHAPVHQAAFGNDCKECHASIRWLGLPDKTGHDAHDKTRFPLAGAHAEVACDRCHDPSVPVKRRFRGLSFAECQSCHTDPHAAQFQDRNKGECGACHTERDFVPTTFGVVEHASSGFALVGGHTAAPCSSCHTGARPRLDWQLPKQTCADCHENPHGDQFKTQMAAGGCAHCHTPQAWEAPRIDHSTWPLTGAHAAARCEQCHTPTEQDRKAGGGVSYREAPRECEGCHNDVHLGQFRLSAPVRPCQDCHETGTFKLPHFDHEQQAHFKLEGRHASQACEQCHAVQPRRSADGAVLGEAIVWRLPYRECADCHANPHERTP